MSGIFGIFQISGSGLSGQRKKLNAVAENIANVETTRTPEGGPYRRKQVVFKESLKLGSFTQSLKSAVTRLVRTDEKHMSLSKKGISSKNDIPSVGSEEMKIEPDSFKMVYDPTHPDADESGYVAMPDINIISEMVDMMAATRAYEANVSAVKAAKAMYKEALNI
ncbi:MAG: flagellar basal body rod protein FlgC [Candidatus Zixiibacteriota bacterium]|nr:MAG: flagellar basal body rod protein FlgC [candidate division Zixibacteria bacterium]